MTPSASLLERLDRLTRSTSQRGGDDAASATTSSSLEPRVDDPAHLAQVGPGSDDEPFDLPAGGPPSRIGADPSSFGRLPPARRPFDHGGGRPTTRGGMPRVSSDPHGLAGHAGPVHTGGGGRLGPSSVTESLLEAEGGAGLGGAGRSPEERAQRVGSWLQQVPEADVSRSPSGSESSSSASGHSSADSEDVPETPREQFQDDLLREALRMGLPRWDVPRDEANRVADLLAGSWRNARPGPRFDRALRFFTNHNSIRDLEEELSVLYDRAREDMRLGIPPSQDEELMRAFNDVSGALIRLVDDQFRDGLGGSGG